MTLARISVWTGVLLFVGACARGTALFLGYIDSTGVGDILAAVLGAFLLSNGSSYLIGERDGSAGIHRRRREVRAEALTYEIGLTPASVPPAAGRQDASLPPAPGSDTQTQRLPRVAPGGFPVHMPVVAPLRQCIAGPLAEYRLREIAGTIPCHWCPHVAPNVAADGWRRGMGTFIVCPCCLDRYNR